MTQAKPSWTAEAASRSKGGAKSALATVPITTFSCAHRVSERDMDHALRCQSPRHGPIGSLVAASLVAAAEKCKFGALSWQPSHHRACGGLLATAHHHAGCGVLGVRRSDHGPGAAEARGTAWRCAHRGEGHRRVPVGLARVDGSRLRHRR